MRCDRKGEVGMKKYSQHRRSFIATLFLFSIMSVQAQNSFFDTIKSYLSPKANTHATKDDHKQKENVQIKKRPTLWKQFYNTYKNSINFFKSNALSFDIFSCFVTPLLSSFLCTMIIMKKLAKRGIRPRLSLLLKNGIDDHYCYTNISEATQKAIEICNNAYNCPGNGMLILGVNSTNETAVPLVGAAIPDNTIFIHEEFYQGISNNTQEYISFVTSTLAHEYAHILNNHVLKDIALMIAITISFPILKKIVNTLHDFLIKTYKLKPNMKTFQLLSFIRTCNETICSSYLARTIILLFLNAKISRLNERDADITAVKALGEARSLIITLAKLKNAFRNIRIHRSFWNNWNKWRQLLLPTHPSIAKRIQYLQEYASKNNLPA
jgi:hypothetical protein